MESRDRGGRRSAGRTHDETCHSSCSKSSGLRKKRVFIPQLGTISLQQHREREYNCLQSSNMSRQANWHLDPGFGQVESDDTENKGKVSVTSAQNMG